MAEQVPYDGYAFYDTLSEIQGYLAELRYIDTAMKYMADEEAGWAQEYLGGIVTPTNEYIEVEYGRTFPFTKKYPVPNDWFDSPFGLFDDTKSERINNRLNELAGEADTWAATEIQNVKDRVEPFTWPQGSSYESNCIQPIGEAHELLEDEISNDFGRLEHTLSDWKGDAADNFASYFYYPFEHTRRSQKQMLTALMGGIASAKAIAESTQHSLMNVVFATKAALREQLERSQATAELERQKSLQTTLIIAGGAATVFAGIFTAGAAAGATAGLWAAAFTTVAGGAQLATVAIPSDGATEYSIEGGTAEALRDSLSDAITQIKTNDGDEHETLLTEVNNVLSRVETLRGGPDGDDGRLIPIQPDIVNGVDSDSFYLP